MRVAIFGFLIFLVSAALSIGALNDAPFFTRGEAREALVVRDMFAQNNFVLPLRGGFDIPSKPPMFHWSAALSSSASKGQSEWHIRLPSAIYAAAALALLAMFAFSCASMRVAIISVVLCLTSAEWLRSASQARVDMTFAFFFGASVWSLYLLLSRKRWFYVGLSGLLLAGAVLAKGPVGLLLPLGIVGVVVLQRILLARSIKEIRIAGLLEAVLLALVLSATWYTAAYVMHGKPFLVRQLYAENVARVFASTQVHVGHEKSVVYVGIYLFNCFLPWSLFLPLTAAWLVSKRADILRRSDLLLSLTWIAAFCVAIGLSVSKRQVYFLPVLPPLAYLTALTLTDREWLQGVCSGVSRSARIMTRYLQGLRYLFFTFAGVCLALALMISALHWLPEGVTTAIAKLAKPQSPEDVAPILVVLTNSFYSIALLALASVVCWLFAKRLLSEKLTSAILALSITVFGFSVFILKQVLPVDAARSDPRAFVAQINKIVPPEGTVVQFQHDFFAVEYYAGRNVRPVGPQSRVFTEEFGYALVRDTDIESFKLLVPSAVAAAQSNNKAANGDTSLWLMRFGREPIAVSAEITPGSAEQTVSHPPDQIQPTEPLPVAPAQSTDVVPPTPDSNEPRELLPLE